MVSIASLLSLRSIFVFFNHRFLCVYQPPTVGPGAPMMQPMMGQPMMGQPMMRPPYAGMAGAAPGAPVTMSTGTLGQQLSHLYLYVYTIYRRYPHVALITFCILIFSFLLDLQVRAPRSPRTHWQISTSRTSYNNPGRSACSVSTPANDRLFIATSIFQMLSFCRANTPPPYARCPSTSADTSSVYILDVNKSASSPPSSRFSCVMS